MIGRVDRAITVGLIGAVILTAGLCLAPVTGEAQETTTRVMIRALAHDGKLIGSGVGGARITVIDARTGSLLAQGIQEGETGDTEKIMLESHDRGEDIYSTEGAAGFLAEIEISEPTQVRIQAEGPLAATHGIQRASRTMLLVPGVDILGDGVILELYGFTVELEEPTESPKEFAGQEIPVRARVTMLCGCPTEPGGLWDSSRYRIFARIVSDAGEILESAPLGYTGETSLYEGPIQIPEGDGLVLQVVAMDPERANFGMAELAFDNLGTGQSSE